ncbi:MAG: orotidine-5'-phosphate decarboxylase/uridine monophosphate synthetase [Verrucomicrobia bacterium]|nr:MAG: orotidine-5'-phosphate decarboxylase/uridine monophosphate synthetase [Verrucomicrobiota bacterium]
MGMKFFEKLSRRQAAIGSRLCVGLDPRWEQTGAETADHLQRVVEETLPFAAAFKPNVAYFEAMGLDGFRLLESVRRWIPEGVPLVLDAKRGDIGETQRYYARACYDVWGADAVTLNAYMGADTLEPFLEREDKGVYVLAVTSNPGASDVETQRLQDGRAVFELIQEMALASDRIGMVVGLTNAGGVLERIADLPLLLPGLGAQGGDLHRLAAGAGFVRQAPLLVNVSRAILFPKPGESPGSAAARFAGEIRQALTPAPQ